jgi:hypothetical protein
MNGEPPFKVFHVDFVDDDNGLTVQGTVEATPSGLTFDPYPNSIYSEKAFSIAWRDFAEIANDNDVVVMVMGES